MAISFNTGTTSTVTAGAAGSHTFTIPAGVLSGDIIYVLVGCFTTATGSLTMTLTSSATTPTTASAQQNTGINGGIQVSSKVFQIVATGSDAGATLTYGATGGSGGSYWFNVGLVAYTGANSTNPDVNAGTEFFNASSVGTTTTPSATTGVSGDWQIQLLMVAPPNGANFTTPGGLTSRETVTSGGNAGILLAIADSNASVGGSGTAIGNTTWTASGAGASNTWSTSFTIGMAPPSGAAVSGTVQPRATVPVARRTPARAVWRGGSGQAFVAVAAPGQQPGPSPRRKPARAYVQFKPVTTTNAAPVVATTSAGPAVGVLPYAGGLVLQSFSQTFTASGSWTAPAGIIGAPAVYAWGPSGTAATGTAGTGAGGGGGGSFGGEPALGGVTPGTVLTVTIGGAGSGTATTVTGGSVTVTGNAGGNASTGTGGGAGAASTNTIAFAGGAGGNGAAGGSGGGGGGGGSGGSTGAGGTGNPGSGVTGGTGGTAGTGAAGLTGAAGGNGGTASNGAAGTAPGGAGGGGSGGATHTGGAATAGQAVIVWQVLTPVPMAMQRRALTRARVQFTPVRTTNPVATPAPGQLPRTLPRRVPSRAVVQFTPVRTTNNTAFVSVAAPVQQPRPAPRRTPARAFIQFRPVRTTNAAPSVILGTPPTIPTSGGDRSPTIRVFREIRPGDVPTSGAQLPRLTGRAFAVPIPVDTDHTTHAWDETPEEAPPAPSGPSLLDQARAELDELAKAARDAADAIDRAADRARPIVEGIGSKAYDLGKIFGSQPYDPRPRKVCGSVHMAGGVTLTCQRKPHDDGWHSDKGLHWR